MRNSRYCQFHAAKEIERLADALKEASDAVPVTISFPTTVAADCELSPADPEFEMVLGRLVLERHPLLQAAVGGQSKVISA